MRYRVISLAILQWIITVLFLTTSWKTALIIYALFLIASFFIFLDLRTILCCMIFTATSIVVLHIHHLSLINTPIHSLAKNGEYISYQCELRSDPHQLPDKMEYGKTSRGNFTSLCSLSHFSQGGKEQSAHLPVRIVSRPPILGTVGEKVEGFGQLFPTTEKAVATLIYSRNGVSKVASANGFNEWVNHFRENFSHFASQIRGDAGALIPGLIIGDTSRESHTLLQQMQRAGLTHLTAVSGENFTIIVVAFLWVLMKIFPFFRTRYLIVGIACLIFIFIARPSPSVMRASIMISLLLLGKAKGFSVDPIPTLGAAILILISVNPFEALDPGFALSSLATLGILLLYPRLERWSVARWRGEGRIHRYLFAPLLLAITANLFTAPIAISLSGYFSWTAIPSNALIEPLVAPVTVFGCLALIFAQFSPAIAHLLLFCCLPFSWSIVKLAGVFSHLPTIG